MRVVILFSVLFFAFSAHAETIKVRASAQSESVRLVLEFKNRPKWTLQRRGIGYRFQFSSVSPISFDLSQVFGKIDRNHVRDVRAIGNNVLEIDLGCHCDVSATETGAATIVFDIHAASSRPDTLLVEAPDFQLRVETDDHLNLPTKVDRSPSGRLKPPKLQGTKLLHIHMPASQSVSGADGFPLEIDHQVNSESVQLIARALARAASQGLVEATQELTTRPHEEFAILADKLERRGNLSVSTGFDTAIPSQLRDIPPTNAGNSCLSNDEIDVASWGDIGQRSMLGELRAAAIAEDGSVKPEGAQALSRYYIYLGFGAEAKQTARFMDASPARAIIYALADVMDMQKSNAHVFVGQVACLGSVSLWALLAHPSHASELHENTNEVLSAFSALPIHLRSHLGPRLSKRLHDAGFSEQARTAINAVTRGGAHTERSQLARARLELSGTHASKARSTLSTISNGTSVTAATALLELLMDAEKRGMAPNPSWVEDAPTLVGALEGTEIAERLNIAGLKGLIALGRYDQFRQAISENSPGLTSNVRNKLALFALQSALRDGNDRQFLMAEIAFSNIVEPKSLDRDTRFAFAQRLIDVGLPKRAKAYINQVPDTIAELKTAVRVMLLNGDTQAAVDLARSSKIGATENILAEALGAADEVQKAIMAYHDAGEIERARAAAMRNGSWDWFAQSGDDEVANAVNDLLLDYEETSSHKSVSNGSLISSLRKRRAQMRVLLELSESILGSREFTN